MEGFSFVTPVTGLSKPNTGKEDVDEEEEKEWKFIRDVLNYSREIRYFFYLYLCRYLL
jgi:hypothetical protein